MATVRIKNTRSLAIAILVSCLFLPTSLHSQSQQSSPAAPPLSSEEKRRILAQLYELQSCRGEVASYEEFVNREREQDAQERANWQRAVDLEKQATALAQKERDLSLEKAAFYEAQFKSLTKKPGLGCRVLAAITLGVHRCN